MALSTFYDWCMVESHKPASTIWEKLKYTDLHASLAIFIISFGFRPSCFIILKWDIIDPLIVGKVL